MFRILYRYEFIIIILFPILQVVPGFWYNWHFHISIGYSLAALTAEINSFFLHSRKLLQISDVGFDTVLYRLCAYLNLVTFFMCRIIPIGFIVNHLFGSHGAIHRQRLGVIYVYSFRVIMVIVAVVNVVLFWRLLKTDLLRPLLVKKRLKEVKANGNSHEQINNNQINRGWTNMHQFVHFQQFYFFIIL